MRAGQGGRHRAESRHRSSPMGREQAGTVEQAKFVPLVGSNHRVDRFSVVGCWQLRTLSGLTLPQSDPCRADSARPHPRTSAPAHSPGADLHGPAGRDGFGYDSPRPLQRAGALKKRAGHYPQRREGWVQNTKSCRTSMTQQQAYNAAERSRRVDRELPAYSLLLPPRHSRLLFPARARRVRGDLLDSIGLPGAVCVRPSKTPRPQARYLLVAGARARAVAFSSRHRGAGFKISAGIVRWFKRSLRRACRAGRPSRFRCPCCVAP